LSAQKAKQSLGKRCSVQTLNLANLLSVKEFVSQWTKPVDILVCNAGIWGPPSLKFAQDSGLELTLATNHLGHFALVLGLLNANKLNNNSHIIVLSSSLHDPNQSNGRMGSPNFDFDDLKWSKNSYDPRTAYQNSKLANIWFTYELDRNLKKMESKIRVNAVCPGFVPTTQLSRNSSFFSRMVLKIVFPLLSFTVSVDQAADWVVEACLNQTDSGKLFSKGQIIASSDESYDAEKAAKLWNLSCDCIPFQINELLKNPKYL
jgi:NAD(P)-dependent dehydrogenase (short-subunit alcohol dehydrogenase family)